VKQQTDLKTKLTVKTGVLQFRSAYTRAATALKPSRHCCTQRHNIHHKVKIIALTESETTFETTHT